MESKSRLDQENTVFLATADIISLNVLISDRLKKAQSRKPTKWQKAEISALLKIHRKLLPRPKTEYNGAQVFFMLNETARSWNLETYLKERFYEVKEVFIESYGVHQGYAVQWLPVQECSHCEGEYFAMCHSCEATGIYRDRKTVFHNVYRLGSDDANYLVPTNIPRGKKVADIEGLIKSRYSVDSDLFTATLNYLVEMHRQRSLTFEYELPF